MKCKFCGKEIEEGSLFCGYCGKEQPKGKACVKCGREIDADAEFCGYCGAKQSVIEVSTPIADDKNDSVNIVPESKQDVQSIEPQQSSNNIVFEESTKQAEVINDDSYSYTDGNSDTNSSKKKWYLIGAIALIAVVGVYFYSGNKNSTDSNIVATESTSVLKARMQEILSEAIKNSEDSTLYEKYCTADFRKVFEDYRKSQKQVYDTNVPPSMDNFYNIWDCGLTGGHGGSYREPSTEFEVVSDTLLSETKGEVVVSFKPAPAEEDGVEGSELNATYLLNLVNGSWLIDDVKVEDASIKHEISEFNKCVFEDYKKIMAAKATPNIQKYGPVWKEISGTYWFQGEGALETIEAGDNFKINNEYRHGNIIRETGEIIIYDSNDDIEFDGYMYNGGNTIAGKWKGKEVVLYGVGD